MKRKGMMRVEVQVGKKDASLVRKLASALADDVRAPSVRSLLQQHFSKTESPSLKALLAAAPLEVIELIRDLGLRPRRRAVNYLIDTNIISEVRKGPRCNERVASWYASVKDTELYLSVLVVGTTS